MSTPSGPSAENENEVPERSPLYFLYALAAFGLKICLGLLVLLAALVAVHFPYQTDEPSPHKAPPEDRSYYSGVYTAKAGSNEAEVEESKYVQIARQAIEEERIVPRVKAFAEQYGLGHQRVLDVGAGTGYLQDVVADYVGLDISPTASRYFHKPFVEASATDMPFPDNEFDAVWTIWVLEHVPKPEQALTEIRRVVKNGGLLYLKPAWDCQWWFAEGYEVRPYSDFGVIGKLKKASLSLLASPEYRGYMLMAERYVREMQVKWSAGPARFHYKLLEPNYKDYWVPDSDAINGLDIHEMLRWFTSRGDECLNCEAELAFESDLVIRVHK